MKWHVIAIVALAIYPIRETTARASVSTSESVNSHLQLLNIHTTSRQLPSVYPPIESMRSMLGHHGERADEEQTVVVAT